MRARAHPGSEPTPLPPVAAPHSAPVDLLDRRRFLALASGCLLGSSAGTPVARASTDRPIDVGPITDYKKDEISEKFIQHDIFVIRHRGKLFASAAVCPHKGNCLMLDARNSSRIICSGHSANFTPEGIPQGGPVRRALVRFGISVNDKGRVMVDPSRTFQPAQWEDKSSYLPVTPQ